MTCFLRKSFRLGPLGLNLSKRGIGASVGVKGARIGVDATGKRDAAGGRGGTYFCERFTGGPCGPSAQLPPLPPVWVRVIGWLMFAAVMVAFVLALVWMGQ